jgi:nucleotide-binding universal stress UspA family protein
MLERILVALDSPETSEPLVTTAIALAKPTHARLLLLHALPLEKDETSEDEGHVCLDSNDYTSENHLEWQRCQIDDLEKLRSLYIAVKAAGIFADIAQPIGDPGQKICQIARQWGADLIVMGKKNSSDADQTTLGSVSRYVTNHAFCSTVVMQNQPCDQSVAKDSAMAMAT